MNVISMRGKKITFNQSIIRIDRRSIFGNPVRVGHLCPICHEMHMTNAEVLPCYKRYLWNRMNSDAEFKRSMLEIVNAKALVCWCKPQPCHGDVLVKALEWLRTQ